MAGKEKSGDSKLQDAQKAAEVDQERPSDTSKEALPELLQASVEEKKAANAPQDVVQLALMSMMKLTETLSNRMSLLEKQLTEGGGPRRGIARIPPYVRCGVCKQVVKGSQGSTGICDGTHELVIVAPHDPDLWRQFGGVIWNGVHYRGRSLLPPAIVDAVRAQVNHWTFNEKEKFMKRGRIYGDPFDARTTSPGVMPLVALQGGG